MDETALSKAVDDSLAEEFKTAETPKPQPARPLPSQPSSVRPFMPKATPISGQALTVDDQHARWLQLGEQLHDNLTQNVEHLRRKAEAMHADLVSRLRELKTVQSELANEQEQLRRVRQRLGYGN